MPIELPRGLPFAVDTWTPASAAKRHRFLTHAHRDHLAGIAAAAATNVYATRLTITIARHIFPHLLDRADAFIELDLGSPLLVADPDGDFTVTAFDANHCPGAVMFLFDGASFGCVLHTGDCRLTADTDSLHRRLLLVDYVFLDCTFAACSLQFPTKNDSIRQVISCIWDHPNAPVVYLVSDMLGQEEILIEVSKVFGSKIFVDMDKNSECHHTLSLVAPEILTDDSSSRFHVIGFPRLSERATEMIALARAKQQPEPLIIRPSSQWYAYYEPPEGSTTKKKPSLTEPMRDEFGVWHVCFSMHSSREELEEALRIIQPKWVISTTPPCMAIELSYVKKHCFASRLRDDDPLWKMLRLADGKPPAVSGSPQDVPTVEIIKKREEEEVTSVEEEPFSAESIKMQDDGATLEGFQIIVEPAVTLFGMARFGLTHEPELWKDEHESVQVIEEDENSATECEQWKDGKSDISSEVIDCVGVVPKEQDTTIESEQLKNCNPELGIKAIDLTEVEVKEHTSCTESALWKKHIGNECVIATEGGGFETEEQKLSGRYHLWEVCKPKEMESVKSIARGKNSAEAFHQVLAVDRQVYSQESNKEVTKEGNVPSETDHENSEVPGKASSDSSNAIGSSKGLSSNLRKLYRSMNVPVPRPLPSLVDLMGASKRPRVSPVVQL